MLISNDSDFKNLPERSDGPFIFSQNNQYLDFNLGSGSFILGHRSKVLLEALSYAKGNGTLFVGGCNILEQFYLSMSKCHPNLESFVLSNTGTEAVLRSIRIARGLTGKNKIILLSGAWHGSHDQTLFNYLDIKDNQKEALSKGIPNCTADNVIFIDPFSSNIEEIISTHKDVACILFEPIQGALPIGLPNSFYESLSNICLKNEIIPIFDEIISGHRVSESGIYNLFNELPSLIVFGKSLGGGLPISTVGISKKISSIYQKEIRRNKLANFFFGGTFTGNPLSIKSAILNLNFIYNNSDLYIHLEETGDYLRKKLNNLFLRNKLDFKMIGYKSISRIINEPKDKDIKSVLERDIYLNKKQLNSIRKIFYNSGIFYGTNNLLFTSHKHTISLIDEYLNKFENNVKR